MHILQAKYRIEDIFRMIKTEIEDLKEKVSGEIRIQGNSLKDLDNFFINHLKILSNNYYIKESCLITIKKKIDEIIIIEKDINTNIKTSLEQLIKEEAIDISEKTSTDTRERKYYS